MRTRALAAAALAMGLLLSIPTAAADMTAEQAATAKWIIEQATAWADQACGGRWVLSDLLADDFQGTAPKGIRYRKPTGEPPRDTTTKWSTDCRMDGAEVRFFSADVAVVYGAESKTVALEDSKQERRCLVWTDTWMRRNGKWQIIAVQDNRVDCLTKTP
jgi:hypothetical protein